MNKKELNIALVILSLLLMFAFCQTIQLHFLHKSKNELKAHISQTYEQNEQTERQPVEI